ncbi:hypothetical protein KKA33_03010 [Patescibacteria group bacterium]|nr:hypothetical protein [Patescibacteria group bacterium]
MIRRLLSYRKTIAGLGVLGGFFVLKPTGCLEGTPVKPESKKPALAEQAPAINQSQQKVREALVAALNQKQEPAPEIHVPDDIGFGGPGPEADATGNPKKTVAFLFLSLPYDELDRSVRQTGFDEIEGMDELMIAFKRLQEAIKEDGKEEISDKAKEFLRLTSVLETSEAKRKYREIKKGLSEGLDDDKLLHLIKSVLIPARDYAEQLASQ